MYAIDSTPTEQQIDDMKRGFNALWALVLKNRACLERLMAFNREINVYLTLKTWDSWIDFQALINTYEPALAKANLFLQEFDALKLRNNDIEKELLDYGRHLKLEMKSSNIELLLAKYQKLAHIAQQKVDAQQALLALSQIEAQDRHYRLARLAQAGYVDHGDGTITDTKNSLMWMQCADGQTGHLCEGAELQYAWDVAMSLPIQLNKHGGFAGYSDWRLPTLPEMQTLVRKEVRPTINVEAFPNASVSIFWTSTLATNHGREAFNVYFGSGSEGSNDRTNYFSVRLVRTTQ